MAKHIGDLPHALTHGDELIRRLTGKVPAVFLDYDGTLTPIVDRPEDAVISQDMRNAVRQLAERCPVCVVSGRDRWVVQELGTDFWNKWREDFARARCRSITGRGDSAAPSTG